MRYLGWDVGGANIKAALVKVNESSFSICRTYERYLPLWKGGKKSLPDVLHEIHTLLAGSDSLDGVGITMTAELSDVFNSKLEGVSFVLGCIKEISGTIKPLVVDFDGGLLSVKESLEDHLKVAGANWAATAKILSGIFKQCILLDVGSTTTDIIPILKNEIAAEGKTDSKRLATGELVYTGALRSSIPSIVHNIPLNGIPTEVASELFALSGDVHLILGNISEEEYSTETADGRGKSRKECLSRLARVVCEDLDMIGELELERIASFIHDKQIQKIVRGLEKVWSKIDLDEDAKTEFPMVTTGIGGIFLGRKAALKMGFRRLLDLETVLGLKSSQAAAAVSAALLVALAKGEAIDWPTF